MGAGGDAGKDGYVEATAGGSVLSFRNGFLIVSVAIGPLTVSFFHRSCNNW